VLSVLLKFWHEQRRSSSAVLGLPLCRSIRQCPNRGIQSVHLLRCLVPLSPQQRDYVHLVPRGEDSNRRSSECALVARDFGTLIWPHFGRLLRNTSAWD